MSKEQMKILEMLEEGKITSEEATQLLEALKVADYPPYHPEELAVFEQSLSEALPVQEETATDISHSHGHIRVKGWDKEEVRLEGKKIVRARDRATAQMYAEQMKVEIKSNQRQITVRTFRPEPEEAWRIKEQTINYELYAPHRFNVALQHAHGRVLTEHFAGNLEVHNQHGSLQVEDIGRDASIQHEHGHVEVAQIGGDVSVRKSHGNLKIKEAKGQLKLDHEHGHVDLTKIGKTVDLIKRHGHLNIVDVGGALQLDHEHGHLQLHHIGGNVEIKKSHGNLDIEDVQGRLSLSSEQGHLHALDIQGDLKARGSGGRMSIENVSGTADIVLSQGQVRLRNVQEAVSIRNRQGSIEVMAPHPVTHPYRLRTEHANLTLIMPEDAQVDLSAQTEHGHIHSDPPLTITQKGHRVTAEGSLNGGGIAFELLNHHGGIQIETRGVSDKKQTN